MNTGGGGLLRSRLKLTSLICAAVYSSMFVLRPAYGSMLQPSNSSSCERQFGPNTKGGSSSGGPKPGTVTVLMVAVGQGEAQDEVGPEARYFFNNLQNITDYQRIPASDTVCFNKTRGTILGQEVMVVASGISPLAAALCTFEVLTCAPHIKEIIYSGSSGWSSQIGGLFNPPNCAFNEGEITRLGDVCVFTSAIIWDCKKATWDEQCQGFPGSEGFPDVCTSPAYSVGPDTPDFFGKCLFNEFHLGDKTLADDLLKANAMPGAEATFAKRDAKITEYEKGYWGAMNVTGIDYHYTDSVAQSHPKLWTYTQCAEATSQFFWSGPTYDVLARNYTSTVISREYNQTVPGFENGVDSSGVIAVTAEEASGVLFAMEKYLSVDQGDAAPVPLLLLRSNSNFAYRPVVRTPDEEIPSDDGPAYKSGHLRELTVEEFKDAPPVNSYPFAHASFSAAVFNYLAMRCQEAGSGASQCNTTGMIVLDA